MKRLALWAVLLAGALIASLSGAHAERRVALVIGNSAYANTAPLANPANDAADIAAVLARLGFDVISEKDLTKPKMDQAFRRFARAMVGADAALFFYAGHGMQFNGINYLMPVDAKLEHETDLPYEMAKLDDVMADMARVNGVRIVVLDACRDNPLEQRLKRSISRTRGVSATRGLARLERTEGILVAYATQPGDVAEDGQGRNSPFTGALLEQMETPGLEVGPLFRRVAAAVNAATGGKQTPELSISLLGEFYFKPTPGQAPAAGGVEEARLSALQKRLKLLEEQLRKKDKTKVAVGVYSDQPGAAAPAPRIEAPNRSFPDNVPIDPDVLRLVETHPFFANAPPVRIEGFEQSVTKTGSSPFKNFTKNHIKWLRPGIVQQDSTSDYSSKWYAGGTYRAEARYTNISAGNGFLTIGFDWDNDTTIPGKAKENSKSKSTVVQLRKLKGALFPVKVGNRFAYETVSENTASSWGDLIQALSCEVVQKFEAKSFHSGLEGSAYLTACETRTSWTKSKNTDTSKSKMLFFDRLGYWLSADPMSPKQRLIDKDSFYELKEVAQAR